MSFRFVFAFGFVLGWAAPALAQDISAQIADQLRAQGYSEIEVSRTWLGRLRIEAQSEAQTREIIVNPRTGEILRDLLTRPDITSSDARDTVGVNILDRPAPPAIANAPEARPDRQAPEPQGGRSGPSGPPGGGPARSADR